MDNADEDTHDAPAVPSSPKELCNALYASCASAGYSSDKLWTQEELLDLKLIPNNDLGQLLACLEELQRRGFLKLLTKDGRPCWRMVKKEDAAKYNGLNLVEAIVYSYIETSKRDGIWVRHIRNKSNLDQASVESACKSLEKKRLVKQIQSAKFLWRKLYMLSSLQPSEDVTGGLFYTNGILDEEFVRQLGIFAERFVMGKSWYHPPTKGASRRKGKSKLSVKEAETLKAEEFKSANAQTRTTMLPYPPGFNGYPTISEITQAINEMGPSTVTVKEAEVSQLMDLLCWDGRVMKVAKGRGFKSVCSVNEYSGQDMENGLSEAPCGRCPVFDVCEEGAPVNARSCVYFQDWLNN